MRSQYPDSKDPNSLEAGQKYEDVIAYVLYRKNDEHQIHPYRTQREQFTIGESPEGIEIKEDKRSADTGHLSIEIAEKTWVGGPEVPSGIFRQDNTKIYVQGNHREFWGFPKTDLVGYFNRVRPPTRWTISTLKSFFLEREMVNALAIFHYQIFPGDWKRAEEWVKIRSFLEEQAKGYLVWLERYR